MNSIKALESFMITNEGFFFNKKDKGSSYKAPPKPSNDEIIQKYKKLYGIELIEYPEDKFNSESEVINAIRKDVTAWVSKIKNSADYRQFVNTACTDVKKKIDDDSEKLSNSSDFLYIALVEELELSKSQITPANVLKYIKLHEGEDGWETGIAITSDDASQYMNLFLGDICETLSKMLEVAYTNHLKSADFGDGDEGHVYYTLK